MIELILIAVIIIQAIIHFIERRDMYDRLMSKDYSEYNRSRTPPSSKHIPSAHEQTLKRWKMRKAGEDE